jgi:hypothetical protein
MVVDYTLNIYQLCYLTIAHDKDNYNKYVGRQIKTICNKLFVNLDQRDEIRKGVKNWDGIRTHSKIEQ